MICPQTKADCSLEQCQSINRCIVAPPKATMAEIERLVDDYANHLFWPEMASEKKAALMAAIRAYGEG